MICFSFLPRCRPFLGSGGGLGSGTTIVTDDGWLLASENQDGGVSVEKCKFNDSLFLLIVLRVRYARDLLSTKLQS
jgi:hypothetical protein